MQMVVVVVVGGHKLSKHSTVCTCVGFPASYQNVTPTAFGLLLGLCHPLMVDVLIENVVMQLLLWMENANSNSPVYTYVE